MDVSGELVAKFIAAALVAMTFLAVAVQDWNGTSGLTDQANAAIDARRTAQAVEVADQLEDARYRLNFRVSYDNIQLQDDRVVLKIGGEEGVQRIYPHAAVVPGSVSGDHVCVVKSAGETRLTGCEG